MLQDLNKEWKERQLRKSLFIDKGAMKHPPINFAEYRKSCTWTEMPNRFIKPEVPKVQIERIYHENLLKRAKSVSEDPSSIPIVPISPKSVSKRPFYYSPRNEILSVDEFFHAYKDVQSLRKKQAKIKFRQSLVEKCQKIEGLYSERAMTAASSLPNGSPSAKSSNKPMSVRSARNISVPQFIVTSSLNYPVPHQEDNQYALSISPKGLTTPKNFEGFYAERSQTEAALTQPQTECDKILTTREGIAFRVPTSPSEGFTKRQKFTEKEINRHLIQGTVCPKPAKHGGKAVEKERAYLAMFKAPEVMDYNVETTIKKAQKMLVKTKSPEKATDELLGLNTKKRFILSKKKDSVKEDQGKIAEDLRATALQVAEDRGNCMKVAKKIKINIKNISMVLSTTPKHLGGIPSTEDTPKENKKEKRPKLRLRTEAEAEEKYNFNKGHKVNNFF